MIEAYYRYLEGCRLVNQFESPERGWDQHHILPQSLFHGLGPKIWLSPEQHAIASVLQSYAFNAVCVTGWMKKHLPEKWLPLWLYWRQVAQAIRSRSVPLELRGVAVKRYWSELTSEEKTQKALRANEDRMRGVIVHFPTGEKAEYPSMKAAARDLPISFSTIYKLYHNPTKTIFGYRVQAAMGH